MEIQYFKIAGIYVPRVKAVQSNNYYIVDLCNLNDPRVVCKHFDNVKQAKRAIDRGLSGDHYRFSVIKGSELLKNPIKWSGLRNRKIYLDRVTKYNYPPECTTQEERHYFRVGLRQKKRALKARKRKERLKKRRTKD